MNTAIFSNEAEQSFIGCLFMDSELIKETTLQAKNLYVHKHRTIYEAIRGVEDKGRPVDIVAIVEELGNKLEEVGGISELTEMALSVPTTANFKFYEKMIFDKWKIRRAVEITNRANEVVIGDESSEVIPKLINELEKLEDEGEDESEFDLKQSLIDIYDQAQEVRGEITGITTGFNDLDAMTSGTQPGDLIVIGARPSMGKTAFALNVGRNAAEADNAVGVFSLEMNDDLLLKRMLSADGHIDGMKMANPEALFNNDDWVKMAQAMQSISNLPLHIWDKPGVGMPYIRKEVRKFRNKHKDKKVIIIIDYLQLITGNSQHGGNRQQEIGEISRALKNMARELGITVMALSQLSRGVESREDKRPMLSDLRESGQIEQDADIIGFLYRDDYYDKESENQNMIEIIVAKHRNGPIGTISLAYMKEYNKFLNIDWRNKSQV